MATLGKWWKVRAPGRSHRNRPNTSDACQIPHSTLRLPGPATRRCDALGDEGGACAGRAPEHDPGVERGRPAALLPHQRPWRPALPAGRPPAVPHCGRVGHTRRRGRRVDAHPHGATGHGADGSDAHRLRRRRRPAGGPGGDRLVPQRRGLGARRGVPSRPRCHRRGARRDLGAPSGRPRVAGDGRRGPGDHRRPERPAGPQPVLAGARVRRADPRPSRRRWARTGAGHGHRRAGRAHPRRRAPVGRPGHRGRRGARP